ncbi:helix-turn-helix domain-containing protein [Rhodovarius crocodyli]|nr:helix-turn-helix domain-containing protein [Rhodovarius crocodyli]
MSGRDRQKAETRRLRKGGEYRADEVFASMPCTYLHAAACRLSSVAFRVFWLANANYRPPHSDKQRGRAVLAYSQIRYPLGADAKNTLEQQPGQSTIARALREVLASGFVELAAEGTRPRHSGGARGQAAEYHVPCREAGAQLPSQCQNLPRIGGKVRLHVNQMRGLAATLSPHALRALAVLISRSERDGRGTLLDTAPTAIGASDIARLIGIPRSTAHLVLRELVDRAHLCLAAPAAGRRSAKLRLGPKFRQFDRAARQKSPLRGATNTKLKPHRMPH